MHTHAQDLNLSLILYNIYIYIYIRCGIPVVIMGETGCGKTRLIRFMCDLVAQGKNKKNMLIMKASYVYRQHLIYLHTLNVSIYIPTCIPLQVHGGITKEDIEQFLEKAKKQAEINHRENLDTVVFFDEANTTDAIGLIKEIMCDKRLHGKPLPKELQFIAACNPYRRSAHVCLCLHF